MPPAFPRVVATAVLLAWMSPFLAAAPETWADEIDALTKNDAIQPPAPGGVVFLGSSSIRLWSTLAQDFPGIPVMNRGFGGSELADSVFYADRIVIPYRPRTVVLYAGENDLWVGKSPEDVAADFAAFREKIHRALPEARILYLSIKESPSRARIRENMREANRQIAALCAADARCQFVDLTSPLLTVDGGFRPELYLGDQLHLNPSGYVIWTRTLAPLLSAP